MKKVLIFAAGLLQWSVYLGIHRTLKLAITGSQWSPRSLPAGQSAIYVSWHSKTFCFVSYSRGLKIGILTLLDWRNRVYDRMARFFGFETVPMVYGPLALRRLAKILQSGRSVAVAVDGPRGPVGTIRPGVGMLSKIAGKAIIPVQVHCQKSFRLGWRWDRFEIPWPFSRVELSFGEPLFAEAADAEAGLKVLQYRLGKP